jgi:hypothetical protein
MSNIVKYPIKTNKPLFAVPLDYEVATLFSQCWYGQNDPLYAVLSRRGYDRHMITVEATKAEVDRLRETATDIAQAVLEANAEEQRIGKRFLSHTLPDVEGNTPKSKLIKRIIGDDFLRSYFEAILFTGNDESDDSGGDPLDDNYSINDFAYETLVEQVAQCEKFLAMSGVHAAINDDYDQAGYDFLMTRNGHGVGFWETDDWPEKAGKLLTAASKKQGEVYIYLGDDGKIYVDGGY